MYLLNLVLYLQPLPQLLQQPLLNIMPGAVFGFLIDNLQHLGKVLEEAGLIAMMILALGILGAGYGYSRTKKVFSGQALLFGGVAWVVTTMVLLPLSGDGFGGLAEGLVAPVAWATLYCEYAIIMEAAFLKWLVIPVASRDGGDTDPVDAGRRRLLRAIPLLVGGGSLIMLGVRLMPGWYQSVYSPPEKAGAGPSPEITPVEHFYTVSKNFSDPVVAEAGWSLSVKGMVQNPRKYLLADLMARSTTNQTVTMECVSNNVGGPLMSTTVFGGIPLRDLLSEAGPEPAATTVVFTARDGYSESLPLKLVMDAPEVMLVHTMGGAPLTDRHGFPARILTPGHYGVKSTKWVESIELIAGERNGYWENQGWDRTETIRTTSRIDFPRKDAFIRLGTVEIAGIAFAGNRGISKVEVSTDGGKSWNRARTKPALSNLAWTLWSFEWAPAQEGAYTLQVRSTDGSGEMQKAGNAPSFPSGATGYHTVQVSVTK